MQNLKEALSGERQSNNERLPWETPVMTVNHAMYEGILCNSETGNSDDSPGTKKLDIQQMEGIDVGY